MFDREEFEKMTDQEAAQALRIMVASVNQATSYLTEDRRMKVEFEHFMRCNVGDIDLQILSVDIVKPL